MRLIAIALLGCTLCCVANGEMYVTPQFELADVRVQVDIPYGTKVDQAGRETRLLLDLFQPPQAEPSVPRPLIVLIHGGGFVGGTKQAHRKWALEYARRGYVAACISYRLTPKPIRDAKPENFVTAATHATEDGMDSIRFLKTSSAKYGIDPHRIATIGTSAGGWISGFNATDADVFNGVKNSYPGTSSRVQAAIASGVSYADAPMHRAMRDTLISFDADDTPIMLFHAQQTDRVTTATWSDAIYLQQRIVESGNTCELHEQPGDTHTDNMSPSGPYWSEISAFLTKHLDL